MKKPETIQADQRNPYAGPMVILAPEEWDRAAEALRVVAAIEALRPRKIQWYDSPPSCVVLFVHNATLEMESGTTLAEALDNAVAAKGGKGES